MFNQDYYKQVELLLQVMPIVSRHTCFSLKGGTAINLFLNDGIPRLSVDIDLTYLPIETRHETIEGIHKALQKISNDIKSEVKNAYPKIKVVPDSQNGKFAKLIVFSELIQVKIEPNLLLRGEIYKSSIMPISKSVSNIFNLDLEAQVMSVPDIYGGKICAALDRQHPRDLFDVKAMFEKFGFTNEIRTAFVIYLASHNRPIVELIQPKFQDLHAIYEQQFKGMTKEEVSLDELVQTRELLVKTINDDLTEAERKFLLSIKLAEPQWELINIEGVEQLPAIQWKLANIKKIDKAKHAVLVANLRQALKI